MVRLSHEEAPMCATVPLKRLPTYVVYALVLLAWIRPTPTPAQVGDTLPAALIGQIAAVAGGYRTGGVAFVAFCRTPPRVMGIFDTQAAGQAAARAAGSSCGVMPVATQPAQAEPSVPATLAKRLAEAADGYRTGEPVWFAAAFAYPHELRGPFPSEEAALAAIRDVLPSYGVFGPYVTPRDLDRTTVFIGITHMRPTHYVFGRDSLLSWLPEIPLPLDSIESITVTVHPTTRDAYSFEFDPKKSDALFFTLSAVDKFVLPYYAGVLGVDYAAQMRARLRDYIMRSPLIH
jgi:hypothetical protein